MCQYIGRNAREDQVSSVVATRCYKTYAPATTRIISQRELRNDSAAILREVQAGQTIIVTRNGVPVAELRPIQPRRFVPKAVLVEAAARGPRIDADRFRADEEAVMDHDVVDHTLLPDESAISAVTLAELAAGPSAAAGSTFSATATCGSTASTCPCAWATIPSSACWS